MTLLVRIRNEAKSSYVVGLVRIRNEAKSSYVVGTDAGSLLSQAADEIERLRAALRELQRMGDEGMAPSYGEWLTFHAKVAKIAREALNEQNGK